MTYTLMLNDGTSRTVYADKRPSAVPVNEWLAAKLNVSEHDIDRIFVVHPLPVTR